MIPWLHYDRRVQRLRQFCRSVPRAVSPCISKTQKSASAAAIPMRRRFVAFGVLALLLGTARAAPAQQSDRGAVGEYQVKAAFLYHFAKFIEWPAAAKNKPAISVCILGHDPFGPALDFLLEDKMLRQIPFEIHRIGSAAEAKACHLLFLSLTDKDELQAALHTLSNSPTLTVGDSPHFSLSGGMIHLVVEDSKVRFDINVAAAKRAGLAISASLLRLARTVEER